MARVLVITPDILPLEGQSTTGAALRAWGLGQGLRSCGHDVEFAMSREVAEACQYTGIEVHLFEPETLDEFVSKIDPDILLFQHWPMLDALKNPPRGHIVVDFHGPLLLETHFREPKYVEQIVGTKLACLSRADYFTCAGTKQLYYYLAWLLVAGLDLHEFPISVIPFSLSPELPNHSCWSEEPIFVYGGVFLPWQDPTLGLSVLSEELEAARRGELRFFGGKHPWMTLPSERFEKLSQQLRDSSHVRFYPPTPRDKLINEYTGASVAWDVMSRNPEREMAFTSRTVEYLWCGLPVVYNNYAELAEYIAEYDAGWIVDPANESQIRQVAREILNNPEQVRCKGKNAQQLVRERLTWDVTIGPLDAYCRQPFRAARWSDRPILQEPEPTELTARLINQVKKMLPPIMHRQAKHLISRTSGFQK
ncbi:MAG: glycosyltransferase family 4 protein [Iphinoe sp. HA4291-MV1]|jgi:glycosyltransferase involved in cell wall biosynthesis|nr:glycosyltransferase family 4 protein [Iphinoe sp. HA4291-MV1]